MCPARLPRFSRAALRLAFALPLAAALARGTAPQAPVTLTPEILDTLAQQYRDEGLPLPPPDSPPLWLPFQHHTDDGDDQPTQDYVLGFRLTAADAAGPGTFLIGTETLDPRGWWKLDGPPIPVNVKQPQALSLADGPMHFHTFPADAWLTAAIQCQIRGDRGLARQILAWKPMHISRWFVEGRTAPADENDPSANRFLYREMNHGDPRKALAAAAWNHWLNTVLEPGTDRAAAYGHLAELFAHYPEFKGKEREKFLESLRLTVAPSHGKPGSPEALIDALSEGETLSADLRNIAAGLENPNLNALLERGFAAVPALIDHLEDARLVRGTLTPVDGSPQLMQVGYLVTALVEGMAGERFAEFNPPPSQDGVSEAQRRARAWFARASKENEEAYICGHVVPAHPKDHDWLNRAWLWSVVHRYPARLSGVYEQVLKAPFDVDTELASRAVAVCDRIDRQEKLRLLRQGADLPDLSQRTGALHGLLMVDPADANARILRELDRLPKQASPITYGSYAPEEAVAWLVRGSDSPEVWERFEQTARRVDPALRASFLRRINHGSEDPTPRTAQRIAFAKAFLDDPAVWHEGERDPARAWTGPASGGEHPELTHIVGNNAAEELGGLLEVPGYPNNYWTKEEWEKYRAAVRAALAKAAKS